MPFGYELNAKNMFWNKRFGKIGFNLNAYKDNLVMGFSYYKLLSSYAGYCVRLRRSSDSAEQDFGFVNNYIDYPSILAFCGAGSGYVSIWYNQYSGGNDAIQAVTGDQPIIVNSGVFESNGLKSTGTLSLRLSSYAAIDFTSNLFTIILNARQASDTTPGGRYVFSKNLNAATAIQYATLSNVTTLSLRLEGAIDRITASGFNVAVGNAFIEGRTNGNLSLRINNASSNVASYTGALTSKENFVIFGRDETGGIMSAGFVGNVKTLVLFNDNIDLSSFIGKF